jgi:Fanconi-associated nuclease 1
MLLEPSERMALQQIIDLANKCYPRWKELVEQEQKKEDSIYESGEGAYLRRFSPAWVLTRIIHKSLHPLGREVPLAPRARVYAP